MDGPTLADSLGGGAGAAIVGALTGTFGLELIRAWVKRGADKETLSHTLRDELRADLTRLREEMEEREAASSSRLKALESQVEEWRGKYYQLLTDYHTLRVEHKALALELKGLHGAGGAEGGR